MLKKIINLIKHADSCFLKKKEKTLKIPMPGTTHKLIPVRPAMISQIGVTAWAEIYFAHLGRMLPKMLFTVHCRSTARRSSRANKIGCRSRRQRRTGAQERARQSDGFAVTPSVRMWR
jgi:hypothetical protein